MATSGLAPSGVLFVSSSSPVVSAETTGIVVGHERTPNGVPDARVQIALVKSDTGQVEKLSRFIKRFLHRSGTPPGCDQINIAFPVVSADSDHRLLSLQPFGLRPRFFFHAQTNSCLPIVFIDFAQTIENQIGIAGSFDGNREAVARPLKIE